MKRSCVNCQYLVGYSGIEEADPVVIFEAEREKIKNSQDDKEPYFRLTPYCHKNFWSHRGTTWPEPKVFMTRERSQVECLFIPVAYNISISDAEVLEEIRRSELNKKLAAYRWWVPLLISIVALCVSVAMSWNE